MEIKKVIICGLGAVGLTYANKFNDICELKILADYNRIKRFKENPPKLNEKNLNFNYITPEENWNPDLIIISTKSSGLDSAIDYIKNFVKENTIIISLLNGISSEEIIAKTYGEDRILYSYFIGHSAVRSGNSVIQDGVGKIVFGGEKTKTKALEEFFIKNNIDYEIPQDIIYALWLKFGINIYLNQLSAIMNLTMGEMKNNCEFLKLAQKLLSEAEKIAQASGVKNLQNYKQEALDALNLMCDEGKSSMLQDILAGKQTEVDIFAGEIIRRGKLFGIKTPYNEIIYDMIKVLENKSNS